MSGHDPAYVARASCGCLVAATVDLPEYRTSVAKETADWIKRGYAVERTTVAEAKRDPYFLTFPCPHDGYHPPKQAAATPSGDDPKGRSTDGY